MYLETFKLNANEIRAPNWAELGQVTIHCCYKHEILIVRVAWIAYAMLLQVSEPTQFSPVWSSNFVGIQFNGLQIHGKCIEYWFNWPDRENNMFCIIEYRKIVDQKHSWYTIVRFSWGMSAASHSANT